MNLSKSLWTKLITIGLGATMALGVGLTASKVAEGVQAATSPGTEWVRVTSVAGLTSGDKYVFMGGSTSTNVMGVTRTGTYQDRITLGSATNATNLGSNTIDDQNIGWVLTGSNGVFKISSVKDGTSGYLNYSGSSNAVNYGTTAMDWTFTYVSNLFVVTAPNGRILQYNSGSPRFATYTSSQQKLSLYKQNASVAVTSVDVSPASATIYSGGTANKTVQLGATVLPANATNKNINWSSSNSGIASVNASGLVTAVSAGNATITATAADGSGKSDTSAITVVAKALSSIAVTGSPSKIAYNTGESFDPTGITITATYNNGDTANVPVGDASYSPDPLSYGDTQITVSWGGKSTIISGITVSNVTLTSIAVTGTPNKTSYYAGETFDPTGVTIRAYYSNSTNKVLGYEECTFEPTPLTAGTTSVTVSYATESTSISGLTVTAVVLNNITIKTPASKTNFKLGESFSSAGLVINANYNSGTVEKTSGFSVSGVDTMVLGAQTATVTYESKTVTYSVDVTNSGANAGQYVNNPGVYNNLYTGSGMWTTTTANFGMGTSYQTYSESLLSASDSVGGNNWTLSTAMIGTWGSGTTSSVTGANLGVNTQTLQAVPAYISGMSGYSSLPNSSAGALYIGMNFNVSNPAKFSMKFITEKAMDAYVVYSTNSGTSYSVLGSVQETTESDGSTWNEISYAGESSLGSSVRFGVLLLNSATSKIRCRVGDIGVYSYTPGSQEWVSGDFTPLQQATSFANYVMTGIGNNAEGNCVAVKSELDSEYAAMSDLAKAEFTSNSGTVFVNARARIAYLANWVAAQSPSGIQSNPEEASKSALIASAIIGIVGLSTIAGFYFLRKKKETF